MSTLPGDSEAVVKVKAQLAVIAKEMATPVHTGRLRMFTASSPLALHTVFKRRTGKNNITAKQ